MKLVNPNESPVRGYKFEYDVPVSPRFPKGIYYYTSDAAGLKDFIAKTKRDMISNSITLPDNISALIEDYICTYQPEGRCRYTKGLGDRISKAIGIVAGAADSLTGNKLKLKSKARGCRSCGCRRTKLN